MIYKNEMTHKSDNDMANINKDELQELINKVRSYSSNMSVAFSGNRETLRNLELIFDSKIIWSDDEKTDWRRGMICGMNVCEIRNDFHQNNEILVIPELSKPIKFIFDKDEEAFEKQSITS